MKQAPKDFPGQAFLELLRPPKLAQTRFAMFAAYSADPIVLGGALLNLHSRGRDNTGGNRSDFASAVESLRDKVRFIVQRGRIHRGHRLPKITAVLDQFVHEIPYHESTSSWHPKIALMSYDGEKPQRTWRLWIGSRNLTASRDLDLGLVIEGESRRRKGSQTIEGIGELAATLAAEARLPGVNPIEIREELQSVRWHAPEGIDVSCIELWTQGSEQRQPFSDVKGRRLVVLSPFLCDTFVKSLAKTTVECEERTLVTSLQALRKLGPDSRAQLANFKLLSVAAPNPEGDETSISPAAAQNEPALDEEDEGGTGGDHSGLHAKLFAAIANERVDIVAGSANATDRAWSGRNAEVVARFSGGRSEIDGIMAILGSATPISDTLLQGLVETEADISELKLEQLRWAIADMPLSLCRDGRHFRLTCDHAPLLPASAKLEVGLATMSLQDWKRHATEIEFGEVPLALQTDLLQFRLTMENALPASWLLRVPVAPAIDAERDSAAISRFLSVAGLQTWLREMLEGEAGPGAEDDWDADENNRSMRRESWKYDGFALEDILKAWAKDQSAKTNSLKRVDGMLNRYVAAVLAHGEHLSDDDRADLIALQQTWSVARDVLMAK